MSYSNFIVAKNFQHCNLDSIPYCYGKLINISGYSRLTTCKNYLREKPFFERSLETRKTFLIEKLQRPSCLGLVDMLSQVTLFKKIKSA